MGPPASTFRLGCPSWANKDWLGTLYRPGTRTADVLPQYASVFGAVEGNTTFYSTPAPDVVRRWGEQTPEDFRFCFKLPRGVTHERMLRGAEDEAARFVERLAPLGPRLGPFMIQLHPAFAPDAAPVLERFLAALPEGFRYAVEFRHPGWFGAHAESAAALLGAAGAERVVLDTRGLRSGDPRHPDVAAARHPKPDLPVPPAIGGGSPLLRLIAHPEPAVNDAWFAAWTARVADWLDAGRAPYVFVHCPNDRHSPRLARRFHAALAARGPIAPMPAWPGEASGERQLGLF